MRTPREIMQKDRCISRADKRGKINRKNKVERCRNSLNCTKNIDKIPPRCYSVSVRSTMKCLTTFCLVWGCQIN